MSFTQVPPNSTGNKIDTQTLVNGADTVHRQVVNIGDPTNVNGLVPVNSTMPVEQQNFIPTRQLGPQVFRASFVGAIASGIDTENFDLLQTGPGMTISQSGGNLLIATGTTVNSETIARSKKTFNGALTLKWLAQLSQRIANQNFIIELVDRVGDALSYVINSSTSVTVTFPSGQNPFTSLNVGQSMNMGAITGVAGIPGRYAIASVSGDTVTFTVSAWPASGSGTLNLFGWNYYQAIYTGVTATNVNFDAQRKGYASGATVATINTTATPGHIGIINTDNGQTFFLDKVTTSAGAFAVSGRASRDQNIPDADVNLYLQIRVLNGSSAPASTTTFTLGFVSIEDYTPNYVDISGVRMMGFGGALPVTTQSTTTVSGTVMATGAATTNLLGDVGQQYRANATGAATNAKLIAANTTNPTVVKASAGRLLGWELANTTASWVYVKLHNIATTPTAGSTAVANVIAIPPNGVNNFTLEGGIAFATGIAFTTVTGSTDADATAVAAGAIVGGLFFA